MKWETAFDLKIIVIGIICLSTWWWIPSPAAPYDENGDLAPIHIFVLGTLRYLIAYVGLMICVGAVFIVAWKLLGLVLKSDD